MQDSDFSLPPMVHVPMPFATHGSTLLTVVDRLSRSYAELGGLSSVILSDNRDLRVEGVPSIYVDFTEKCPREWFSRSEMVRDFVVGTLGGTRPFYGHLFDPAIRAAPQSSQGIILVYEGHYAATSLPAWRKAKNGNEIVLYVHNPVSRSYTRPELRRLLGAADRVIFCADHLRKNVEERLGSASVRLETIPNGVDQAFFLPRRRAKVALDDDCTVLYFGRVAENKGIHLMMKAAEKAQTMTSRRLRVRVVGSANYDAGAGLSDYETELRRMGEAMTVPVEFVPFRSRSDVVAALASSHVACLLSTWAEGFPLTVLEAMAAGLPVVCSTRRG